MAIIETTSAIIETTTVHFAIRLSVSAGSGWGALNRGDIAQNGAMPSLKM
jgi:hypothetical protein